MHNRSALTYLSLLCVLLSGCTAIQISPYDYLKTQNIGTPTQNNFPHCYNYGCKVIVNVEFSENDWSEIENIFPETTQNAEDERKNIALAIGKFEQIVGEKTGTKADKFGTFKNSGQFHHDCIDESVNTTIYLTLLQERQLIHLHKTSAPDTRVPLLHGGTWPHRTAVIQEIQTLQDFAIDSWFHDNGYPAEVVPLPIWKKGWKVEENFSRGSDSSHQK